MKCRRLYPIADFENFSPDTLKWLFFAVTAYNTVSVNEGLVDRQNRNTVLSRCRVFLVCLFV